MLIFLYKFVCKSVYVFVDSPVANVVVYYG